MRVQWISFILVVLSPWSCHAAPRSKNKNLPQTVYDQKQKGDYNIQVHLKDFQVIALVSDDTLGDLGDYDYNYDYSEFTIKPSVNSTTSKPANGSSSPSTSTSTVTPAPTSVVVTQNVVTSTPDVTSKKPVAEEKPKPTAISHKSPTETNDVPNVTTASNSSSSTSTQKEVVVSSTTVKPPEVEPPYSPDKIKVQVIDTPFTHDLPVVPAKESGSSTSEIGVGQTLGEVLHYRRCVTGYARDKKGRCRRIRKPGQSPFDFSRLASTLASRFKQATSHDSLYSLQY